MPDHALSNVLRHFRRPRLGQRWTRLFRRASTQPVTVTVTPRPIQPDPPVVPAESASAAPDDTFCVHPWIHLRLLAEGEAQICCRSRTNISKDGTQLSLKTNSFDDLWNSDEMRQIRRDMVDNKYVAGCAECYQEDKSGAISMRKRDNTAWQNGWLNENFVSIDDLKVQAVRSDYRLPIMPANIEVDTGSLCNLKCRMCHDGVSSRIASDVVHRSWTTDQYTDRPYHDQNIVARPAGLRRWSLDDDLETAITRAPGQVKRLYFIGGEPLLVKEVGELLQHLVAVGVSRDITIAVVSNGTVTGSWLELIPHFKELNLSISMDGFDKQYDYIRYPAKWAKLERNLKTFQAMPKTSLGAAITLQAYNALNITDLFRYLDSIGMDFFAWPVHVPRYLSIDAMPPRARRVAAERMSAYADRPSCAPARRELVRGLAELLRPTSDRFDSGLLRDFMLFTNDLDVSRSQSFAEVNGELLELLAEDGFAWTNETVHARRLEVSALSRG